VLIYPCRVRDLDDGLCPNIKKHGSFRWFWCACSVKAEKPKEIIRLPTWTFLFKDFSTRHCGGGIFFSGLHEYVL